MACPVFARVWGLGFRFWGWGLGFRVWGLDFRFRVWGLGFRVALGEGSKT